MTPHRCLPLLICAAVATGCPENQPGGSGTPTPTPTASGAATSGTPQPSPTPVPSPTPFTSELEKKTALAFVALSFVSTDDIVVTVRNLGTSELDLASEKWRLAGNNKYGTLSAGKTTIGAGADVRLHVNAPAGCTESATDFCVQTGVGVSKAKGNLALYKGITEIADFDDSQKLVDYVAWGEPAQARETDAANAKLWRQDEYVQVASDSLSVKVAGDSGLENWN